MFKDPGRSAQYQFCHWTKNGRSYLEVVSDLLSGIIYNHGQRLFVHPSVSASPNMRVLHCGLIEGLSAWHFEVWGPEAEISMQSQVAIDHHGSFGEISEHTVKLNYFNLLIQHFGEHTSCQAVKACLCLPSQFATKFNEVLNQPNWLEYVTARERFLEKIAYTLQGQFGMPDLSPAVRDRTENSRQKRDHA